MKDIKPPCSKKKSRMTWTIKTVTWYSTRTALYNEAEEMGYTVSQPKPTLRDILEQVVAARKNE